MVWLAANLLAVAALPVQEPEEPVTFPVTSPAMSATILSTVRVPSEAFHVSVFLAVLVPDATFSLVNDIRLTRSFDEGFVPRLTRPVFVGALNTAP